MQSGMQRLAMLSIYMSVMRITFCNKPVQVFYIYLYFGRTSHYSGATRENNDKLILDFSSIPHFHFVSTVRQQLVIQVSLTIIPSLFNVHKGVVYNVYSVGIF